MKLISIFATISLLAVVTQAYPGRVYGGIEERGLRARNADHDGDDGHDHVNLRKREDYPGDGGDDGDDGGDILI
jgi:hypothetical protein